jgi:hypothetical protein
MLRPFGGVLALLLLASCGTPEFRAERSLCTAEWSKKIEPRLERELYNRSVSRQVPTGRTVCKTSGETTVCDRVMRTEYFTVPAVRTVDRNKPRRDAQILQCTQNICLEKFGNAECKT